MKKISLLLLLIATTTLLGHTQTVDNFDIGPYEVDYRGEGDFKYRLRKGIDLYKYYGLKKDTIIMVQEVGNQAVPFKKGIHIDLSYTLPRFTPRGYTNIFGVDGNWKQNIARNLYFNAGLALSIGYGKFNAEFNDMKDVIFYAGIPLSIEYSQLARHKSSLFVNAGFIPTIFSTVYAKQTINGERKDVDKESGFLIIPRVEFGGYLPLGNNLLKLGVYGEYFINCSSGDVNIYENRIGRAFIGAAIGIIL